MYVQGSAPGYSAEEWLSVKYTLGLDFPNVPYYFDEDVRITQSNAILRHLGRKYSMLGKTDAEMRRVDLMLDQTMDLRNGCIKLCYSPDFDSLREKYFEELPQKLKVFEAYLGDNKWFAGDHITIADFHIYEMIDQHKIMEPECLKNVPKLETFAARFEGEPKIKAYMESSKFMKTPLNSKNAKY